MFVQEIVEAVSRYMAAWKVILAEEALLPPEVIEDRFGKQLTEDPVFGQMSETTLADFFDRDALTKLKGEASGHGKTIVIGTGATMVCADFSLLVYADMARWELQRRQRKDLIANFGLNNFSERASLKYKRAFFLDWRVADRTKTELLPRLDLLLDTNLPNAPKMISGESFRKGMSTAVTRPFRVVPFFDPGPWGGHWMERVCELPDDGAPNHAWCFDCVPEENSLLLGFGDQRIEIPALDIVLQHPRELLGEAVYKRFGAEFPIRFDFLDTMGGGNLSLQVHPLTEYIREHFGMAYTQDESYYLLDAEPGATVYLGLKEGIDSSRMIAELNRAQQGDFDFPAEKYVDQFPARKHDHFLIPAGTVHCSGKGSMVLEISATPYIFTFKLWDWGRVGLDGYPRPIHLEHGARNIQWDRTTDWVKANLINQFVPVASGDGWREERTGLHELEFIETRRHWFTCAVPHDTWGTVHVLNLVEGEEVIVESPSCTFEPFVVHYAETFIVPATVGAYTIRPHGVSIGKECGTMLAYVRDPSGAWIA
ncbi:MAG TPA: class I mannose-6-phosphate isomerase [Bryocella sp.]|nr:class I mannose-6-phosphate isomerase [Bryocella sp.]